MTLINETISTFCLIELILTMGDCYSHYVRNLNRRHGSEMRTKTIVSDLEK
jgi:hypothetical protein